MNTYELARRFANGNGAIFVGAGLSMGAGLPSWGRLVEPLRARLTGLDPAGQYTPEQIAGWYELDVGRAGLITYLDNELSRHDARPTDCHRLLTSLPVDLYFTTNFDTLLEDTIVRPERVIQEMDFSLFDDASRKKVIKVHGDLRYRDSIVFTKSDYDHYLETRPTIAESVRLAFMQRTVLFIGYSFSDRDLTTLLAQAGRRLGELHRPLYAILINPNAYVVKELEQKYGVRVIALTAPTLRDYGPALKAWLENFKGQIDREVASSAVQHAAPQPSPLPDHGTRFIGRETDIANVIDAFRLSRIVGIHGFPGTGKTALAIEVAKRTDYARKSRLKPGEPLFAYVIYIDALGFDRAEPVLNQVLDKIADTFRLTALKNLDPSRHEQKWAQLAALLKIFCVLVVLDHVAPADLEGLQGWLRQIPEPSAVLLVTRAHWTALEQSVQVAGLERHEALHLLRALLGDEGPAVEEPMLHDLIARVHGNPQCLKWLAGQLATLGKGAAAEDICIEDADMLKGCTHVLQRSWDLLGEHGRTVLLVASIFAPGHMSLVALRHVTALEADAFSAALRECENSALLEFYTELRPAAGRTSGHRLHPMTAYLAQAELAKIGGLADTFHSRLVAYYRVFVRRAVIRPKPCAPYWNALVSEKMLVIDDDWPTIRRALVWSIDHDSEFLIEMVFLLVHYMDTRLLNGDRIHFSQAAIAALRAAHRVREEALLRIDALGWTLVEESRFREAEEQISHGLDLIEQADCAERAELQLLAWSWLARAKCETGQTDAARDLINRTIDSAAGAEAWIRYRVHMVAGDIFVKRNEYPAAVDRYEECLRLVATYGGEDGYQILPRLGMAYLGSGHPDRAEKVFRELQQVSDSHNIDIGILYAQYGLAAIASQDKLYGGTAASQLQQIRARLDRATSSNLLHKLMNGIERQR